MLRGYVLAWAINEDGAEIRWNHLAGSAIIVNYQDGASWEYNGWAFGALAGATTGSLLNSPLGRLDLDGLEYEAAPASLVFDFIASGSVLVSGFGQAVFVDTDLTLWAAVKDLRSP